MLLQFPDSETLVLAIHSGTIPEDIAAAPVMAAVDDDATIWVEFTGPLPRSLTSQLKSWGAAVRRGKGRLASRFVAYDCWLPLVPLRKEPHIREPGDRTSVLFQLRDDRLLPELVNEILRQGNDRQSFRRAGRGDETCILLQVIGAPYYSLLRASEQWSDGRVTAFVERAPRVWIEAGYQHPLSARLSPHASQHLLIRQDQTWQFLQDEPFEDIYRHTDFQLPEAPEPLTSAGDVRRLNVPVRLARSSGDKTAEIYVLTRDAAAQLDQFVQSSSDAVLERLAFAVAEPAGPDNDSQSSEPVIIVRIRPGRTAPPVLVFDALACRSFLKIPNLFVPTGLRLHPPLRRDAVRDLLAREESQLVWLAPVDASEQTAGSTLPFVVRRIADSAFLPLTNWVDYVLERDQETLSTWQMSHQFAFSDFICRDDQPAARKRPAEKPKPVRPAATAPPTTASETERQTTVEKLIERFRGSTQTPVEDAQITQWKAALTDLETRFLELDAPLEDSRRAPLWDEMANLNAALERFSDSSICRQHRLWDTNPAETEDGNTQTTPTKAADHSENAELWFQTDVQAARRLGGTPLLNDQGRVTERELRRVLKSGSPSPSEVAQIASWVTWAGHDADARPLLQKSLAAVQQYLERYESAIAVRAGWLAWTTLAQLSEDVLLLARARDRLLERIYQHGLTADRDLPSFLRSGGNQSGDRFRQVREKVHDLHRTILAWSVANRGMASPKTKHYIDLVLSFAYARLGEQSAATELLHTAEQGLLDKPDVVHHWLYDAYRFRIEAVLTGQTIGSFPGELLARLEQIERIDRYKVDRLRQHSGILEPMEKLDPYREWRRRDDDDLEKQLADLFAINDREQLTDQLDRILQRKLPPDERARALSVALELSPRLGEQFASRLLVDVVPLDRQLKDPVVRANLLEKGLQIAAHFDHAAAVQDAFSRMTALLQGLKHADVNTLQAIESLLSRSFITLRKMGMRDEIAFLLESMTRLVRDSREGQGMETERLRILLQLAGGWFYFGQDRGWTDIDVARELLLSGRLTEEGHVGARKQTDLAISYLTAVGQAPLEQAVARIDDLFRKLTGIRDGATVNSHYSLKQLDIVEALVQTIVSDSFTMDANSQRWMDDEEFLIRRRIHHDMRQMLDAS